MANQTLKPAAKSKMLGCAYGGGRRRATSVIQGRITKYRAVVPSVQALKGLGGSSLEYVRTAGTPGMIYGSELLGTAPTMLNKITGLAARAVAPPLQAKTRRLLGTQ